MPYDPGASIWSDPILDALGKPTGSFSAAKIQWDANGRPYRKQVNGQPSYVSPAEAVNDRDPKVAAWGKQAQSVAPTGGFASRSSTWNSAKGDWDRGSIFNTSLGGLLLGGGALAAPYVAGALGAGAAGGGASGASGAASGAGAGAAGVLPSTTIGTGMVGGLAGAGAAPAVTASTMAGVGGTAALKGASSWLTGGTGSDLIKTGIGAGLNIYGANKAAGAQDRATDAQLDYYNRALAAQKEQQEYERKHQAEQDLYERGHTAAREAYSDRQRAEFLDRASPYVSTGTAAQQRLAALLGLR